MALNLTDRMAVRRVLIERCTAVVANYALYILGNNDATEAQKDWAKIAIKGPSSIGESAS